MKDHDERPIDAHSGIQTTGHEWDGIRELDNPLPRWWLIVFYACIVGSIIYWILMPAWPGLTGHTRGLLGQSDRLQVARDLEALKVQRGERFEQLTALSVQEIAANADLRTFGEHVGQSAFGDNCATCHGTGGAGRPGYPVLADNVWIWGGTLADIEQTITFGVRNTHPDTRFSQMPAFGRDELLSADEIKDLTQYVLKLSGSPADDAAVARAQPVYETQCASCHGVSGDGDRAFGAPALTDKVWLYGGTPQAISQQIYSGRGGVMPNWNERMTPGTIKSLAIYVWSLGGGEADPAPEPASAPIPAPADGAAPAAGAKPGAPMAP